MLGFLLHFLVIFWIAEAAIISLPNTVSPKVENVSSVTIPKIPMRPRGFTADRDSKILAVQRFKLLVSDFLTDAQLSKSIDVAAVGMHKGKPLDDILDDVYTRLRRNLTTKQISELTKAQKGLIENLDEKSAKLVKARVKRMIVYSFDPAAEQIHKFATRPSMAFALIAETINERFVGSVKDLIRDVLTPKEYDVFRKHYHPRIFKLDNDDKSMEIVNMTTPRTVNKPLWW
ncbi:hypothetical protein L5515_013963 [Caenorhabditis briggsae]|uniref:Fatty-acid and retinol-binding protein 1 n=2 Tax=Caenorhabditis briggsae TaxID=6238 RepID=A0AAE9EC12_CAEBR|nr:hypothetical protein L5515_013963 [Caenorhabditis briggsae]